MREDRCHAQVNAEMRMLSHHTPCRPDLHRTPLAAVVRLSTRWGVRLDSGAQGDPVCGRPLQEMRCLRVLRTNLEQVLALRVALLHTPLIALELGPVPLGRVAPASPRLRSSTTPVVSTRVRIAQNTSGRRAHSGARTMVFLMTQRRGGLSAHASSGYHQRGGALQCPMSLCIPIASVQRVSLVPALDDGQKPQGTGGRLTHSERCACAGAPLR